MTGRDLALNPTYDMNAAAGSERSVQAPLPSRVIATVTLDNVTFQYLNLTAWAGAYVRLSAPEDLYYLCVESGTPATPPVPANVSGDGCVDYLPANTPDFFIVHPDRAFLAVRNVSAAGLSEARVSRR
jgi:hypothetical protein